MLRASEVIAYFEHALGGSLSAEIPPLSIVNQAGRYLFSLHPWKFKQARQAELDLRAPITITGATWDEPSLTLTKVGAFPAYAFLAADDIRITGGTNAATGRVKIASRPSNDAIVLEESIGATAHGSTDIAGTITLDTVALPDDFEALVPPQGLVGRQSASLYGFRPCSMHDLLSARAQGIPNDIGFMGAIGSGWTKLLPPRPILEVYPAPTAGVEGAFGISYYAKFAEIADANEVLRLPEHMEALYLQIVRAFAQGYEEADNASMTARLSELTADRDKRTGGLTMFHYAKMQDGAVQPSYGKPMAAGALVRGNSNVTWQPPFQAPIPSSL